MHIDVERNTARNRAAQALFDGLPRRYDRLAEVLSFGQNARWRRAMVDKLLRSSPRRVLDVATGTGGVALQITARADADVVGLDLTEQMLRQAKARVRDQRATARIALTAARAEELPFGDATFDGLSFTYLLRYVDDPVATLTELARVVAPGRPIASLDFTVPPNPLWRAAWWMYTRLLLPVAGMLGGTAWVRVGRFLGPNISAFTARFPPERLVECWREAGIVDVRFRRMSLGGGIVMWGRRAGG